MAYFVDFAKAMLRQNGKKSATSRLNFKMTKTQQKDPDHHVKYIYKLWNHLKFVFCQKKFVKNTEYIRNMTRLLEGEKIAIFGSFAKAIVGKNSKKSET